MYYFGLVNETGIVFWGITSEEAHIFLDSCLKSEYSPAGPIHNMVFYCSKPYDEDNGFSDLRFLAYASADSVWYEFSSVFSGRILIEYIKVK